MIFLLVATFVVGLLLGTTVMAIASASKDPE